MELCENLDEINANLWWISNFMSLGLFVFFTQKTTVYGTQKKKEIKQCKSNKVDSTAQNFIYRKK